MKQKSQVRNPNKVPATPARSWVQNESVDVINEADLDKVSGGGGLSGGVLGDRRLV